MTSQKRTEIALVLSIKDILNMHQKKKSHCLAKLFNFKLDLIKGQLNFGSCNFGLKSHL